MSGEINLEWGRAIIETLTAQGIDTICLAPGSRCTPITLAAEAHESMETISLLEERSAAFFALGWAKARQQPLPLVTTSGTAGANALPAMIEARYGRVPLLILTADRPPELIHSGANQTIDQTHLFGRTPVWDRTLPEPGREARKRRSLRQSISRAVAEATTHPIGGVHLNVPFRKPLQPDPTTLEEEPSNLGKRDGPSSTDGIAHWHQGEMEPSPTDCNKLQTALESAERPLIVAGVDAIDDAPEELLKFAKTATIPLLADVLSNVRFRTWNDERDPRIAGYDGFLHESIANSLPAPDFVLRFGRSPTSKRLRTYLSRSSGPQWIIDPAGEWTESTFTASDVFQCRPKACVSALSPGSIEGNGEWYETWQTLERETRAAVSEGPLPNEASVVHNVFEAIDPDTPVFLGNSTPVRDADRFVPAATVETVTANRGASGIDGTVSTTIGLGAGAERKPVGILGDIATYHDLTGLLSATRSAQSAIFVVINNDGGGIFHRLPISEHEPPFTDRFLTPHGLRFEDAASQFDWTYTAVDPDRITAAVESALARESSTLIEVQTDAGANQRRREAIDTALSERLGPLL